MWGPWPSLVFHLSIVAIWTSLCSEAWTRIPTHPANGETSLRFHHRCGILQMRKMPLGWLCPHRFRRSLQLGGIRMPVAHPWVCIRPLDTHLPLCETLHLLGSLQRVLRAI